MGAIAFGEVLADGVGGREVERDGEQLDVDEGGALQKLYVQ